MSVAKNLSRAALSPLGMLAVAVASITCAGDHATGPNMTSVELAVVPRLALLPAGGPSIQLGHIRGVLRRPGADSVWADAPFQGDSAILRFNVGFDGQSAVFDLSLTAYDRMDQVVFTGADTIRVTPGASSSPVTTAPMRYAGPDTLVASLKVRPSAAQLGAGQSVALDAAGTSLAGQPVAPVLVGWTSRNPAVATVDANGVAHAGLFEGQTWLVARSATNAADSAMVSVRAPVSSITIAPATTNVARGDSVELVANLVDVGGNPITDRLPTWSTSDASKATVTASGWVRGLTLGAVTVTALAEGQTATAQVAVVRRVAAVNISPSPLTLTSLTGTQALQATAVPAAGVPQSVVVGLPASWSTSNAAVATVDSKGVVTAIANGAATITATIDSVSGALPVVVAQVAASLHVSPRPGRVTALKTTMAFHGGAQDTRGQAVADTLLKWMSLDPGIASIASTGVATAIGPGTARIVASSGATADTSTLIVSQIPVVLVASAVPDHAPVNGTAQILPALLDANDQPIQGAAFTYTSLTPNIVGVNAAGLATMLAAGSGQVLVLSGGRSAVASVTAASNEPGGLTVMANNAFTNPVPVGQGVAMPGEAPWQINNPDGLATMLQGGGLQYLYKGGVAQNGDSPATVFLESVAPMPVKTLYARVVWTPSTPWTPSVNGVTKILYASPGVGGDGDVYLMLYGDANGYTINVEPEFPGDTRNLSPNVHTTPVTLGVSHTIEWVIEYGPSGGGAANGVVQWWLDGVLQGSYADVRFPSDPGITGFQLYGGYGFNAPAQDQTYVYSHIYVSGKP